MSPKFLDRSAKTLRDLYLQDFFAFPTNWLSQFDALTVLRIKGCRVSGEEGVPGSDVAIRLDGMPVLQTLEIRDSEEITHISAESEHSCMRQVILDENTALRDVGGFRSAPSCICWLF
eukprot:comp13822_c0_seq1/m.9558 comp13822_c0_seq1/g.9558  ORF comp13822_c0_seq1/g.9558 comp13822_c0_seq1/m.9558 type:complete len:118 (-) comp13822_c0_seq1:1133-1486(-)